MRREKKYTYTQQEELLKKVSSTLVHFYRAAPIAGQFAPHMPQEVISHVLQTTAEAVPPGQPLDAKAYYQEKHELMMKYNQAI